MKRKCRRAHAVQCRCSLPARVSTHRCVKDFLYLFITYHTVAGARARARLPASCLARGGEFEVKTISNIRAAPRVGVMRLWHYFGAGTCSDVDGNQVIACIDRIRRLYAWERGRGRRWERRRRRKDTPRAGYISHHQNAGCYSEVNSGTLRDTSANDATRHAFCGSYNNNDRFFIVTFYVRDF